MENYSGLLPFLWRTLKRERRRRTPEVQRLSVSHTIMEDREDVSHHQDDDAFFLHPGKSPSRFAKSPGLFGRSPGRSSPLPGRTHRRRHSTGLSGFSLPKMLSSSSQRFR